MGPRHQGSKAETLALDAYLKLMRAADSVAARAHVALPAHLTLTQFAALEALYHLGPLFPSELASKLLKSGGNLTLVVKNLERDGLRQWALKIPLAASQLDDWSNAGFCGIPSKQILEPQ